MPLLQIENLQIAYPGPNGPLVVSEDINIEIGASESIGLLGESGCGKTSITLGIMRLLPPQARLSGQIRLKGRNLLCLPDQDMQRIRGKQIAMIFEQPATCLNPVMTVGDQISEVFQFHASYSSKASKKETIELMGRLGIDAPEKRYRHYPHEFSGGMMQRVMIAMALALKPALLIADEPTTALDVTIKAQIVQELKDAIDRTNTSLLLISHDLGITAHLCDRIAVMHGGRIVEVGSRRQILSTPRHPYTRALLDAARGQEDQLFDQDVSRPSKGCRFYPQCPERQSVCKKITPAMRNEVRCFFAD
jgi:oligopeptide/dipeptide ABC transporter ATP-binding protein